MHGIIAEIGNHHLGSLNAAKDLIRIARECGAHFVKMQAIDVFEFNGGSMPKEFYRQCDLGMGGYRECIEFAHMIKMPIFLSVFGSKYQDLAAHYPDMPVKIAASQFKEFPLETLNYWNTQNVHPVVISIPNLSDGEILDRKPYITNMSVMYATPYLETDVNFAAISWYIKLLGKPVGYSDHTAGVENCIAAVLRQGCLLVEKHFNLFGEQFYGGRVYRDSLHAAGAKELSQLCKIYRDSTHAMPNLS